MRACDTIKSTKFEGGIQYRIVYLFLCVQILLYFGD